MTPAARVFPFPVGECRNRHRHSAPHCESPVFLCFVDTCDRCNKIGRGKQVTECKSHPAIIPDRPCNAAANRPAHRLEWGREIPATVQPAYVALGRSGRLPISGVVEVYGDSAELSGDL